MADTLNKYSDHGWLVGAAQFITSLQSELHATGSLASASLMQLTGLVAEAALRFPSEGIKSATLLGSINRGTPILMADLKELRGKLITLVQNGGGSCISSSAWESKNLKPTEARPFHSRLTAACSGTNLKVDLVDLGCSNVVRISADSGLQRVSLLPVFAAITASKGSYRV